MPEVSPAGLGVLQRVGIVVVTAALMVLAFSAGDVAEGAGLSWNLGVLTGFALAAVAVGLAWMTWPGLRAEPRWLGWGLLAGLLCSLGLFAWALSECEHC